MNIKLFTFPYAGGSAMIYKQWPQRLSSSIELIPIELASRGKRMFDPLYEDMEAMVQDAYDMVSAKIDGPYALFGHSMGSIIAFLLSHKLEFQLGQPPEHVFFSGRGAPHLREREIKNYHLMGDDEFEKEVISLGGTPPEFFDHPELLELFLPTLKNDFMLAETDITKYKFNPLECDISVFLGKEEEVTAEEGHGWIRHTEGKCNITYLPGGHFFIHEHFPAMIQEINHTLTSGIKKGSLALSR